MPISFKDVPLREVYGTTLLNNIDSILNVLRDSRFRPVPVMTEKSGVISLTANDAIAIIDQTRAMSSDTDKFEKVVNVDAEDLVCAYLTDDNLKDDTLFLVKDKGNILGCISAQEILVHLTPSIIPRVDNLQLSADFVQVNATDSLYSVHTTLYRQKKDSPGYR